MSQLDYLWLNFGDKTVKPSTTEGDSILTESATIKLINKYTDKNISDLIYEKDPDNKGMVRIVGKNQKGAAVSVVRMPEEIHITNIESRKVAQEDIDKGFNSPIGSEALVFTMNDNSQLLVSLKYTQGGETNSITNNVVDGVIKSHLKINYSKGSILFNETEQGIYADPKISKTDSGVSIEKVDDGIIAKIPLKSSGRNLKIDSVTYSEYLLKKDPETLYFVTDKNRIIFNNQIYTKAPVEIVFQTEEDFFKYAIGHTYEKGTEITIGYDEYCFYEDQIFDENTPKELYKLNLYPSHNKMLRIDANPTNDVLRNSFIEQRITWLQSLGYDQTKVVTEMGKCMGGRYTAFRIGNTTGPLASYYLFGYSLFYNTTISFYQWDITGTTEDAYAWNYNWSKKYFTKIADSNGTSPSLWKAYKELSDKITALTTRVTNLENASK